MTNIKNYNFSGIDLKLNNSEYWDFTLNTDASISSGDYTKSLIASFNFNLIDDLNWVGDFNEADFMIGDFSAPYELISDGDFNEGDFNLCDFSTSFYTTNGDDFNSIDFNISDFETSIHVKTKKDFNENDFNFDDFLVDKGVISEVSWDGHSTSNFSASTYGLTGFDNFSLIYDGVDDSSHNKLLNGLTGSTLTHLSSDNKLHLREVSGATGQYSYPTNFVLTGEDTGNYVDLNGGFYQGYYKLDGFDYQVLPTRYQKGWSIDTWLRKGTPICNGVGGTTLNDLYPNNKGFFYYNGTRAENKFWNIFTGNTIECTSGSTDFCMDVKEIDVNINNIIVDGNETTLSVPLSPPPIDLKEIKNQFLIFGRSNGVLCSNKPSKDGYGQVMAGRNYDKTQTHYSSIVREVQTNFTNPFLIFGRSNGVLCSNEPSSDGYGQVMAGRNYVGTSIPLTELDKEKDIIGNALGFRIKDDGSIGYRILTLSTDCKSVEVIEEYSLSGVVRDGEWENIVVKWVNDDTYNNCDLVNGKPRRGRFKFYINAFLIFVSKELDEFIPKRLDDLMEKQIGVPYNISIGGGTQGLLESITFDGQDPNDLGLVIEQNFAGSFIGSISTFNLRDVGLNWCEIKDLYNDSAPNYK